MKKWLSILMALVLILGMATMALAEETAPAEAPYNKEETLSEEPDPKAVLLSEIQDALNPDRSIQLFARWDGDELFIGDEVRLRVELKGYDGVTYTLAWQYNTDPSNPKCKWKTYASGTDKILTFTLDETNCAYYWRVLVQITGVKR